MIAKSGVGFVTNVSRSIVDWSQARGRAGLPFDEDGEEEQS